MLRSNIRRLFLLLILAIFGCPLILSNVTYADYSNNDLQAILGETPFYYPTSSDCTSNQVSGASSLTSNPNVYLLGDSITLRSQTAYQTAFQQQHITATIDAQTGRSLVTAGTSSENPGTPTDQLTTGLNAITADASSISSANTIVIAIGTNGGDTTDNIDQAIRLIRESNPSATIYWVDTIGVNGANFTNDAIKAANTAIYSEASSQHYQVISWFKTVDPSADPQNPANLKDSNKYIDNSDGLGVHPTSAGITALVNLVVTSLTGNGTANTASTQCSGGSVDLNGATNGIIAYNYFIQIGLNPAAAAGIVGNMTEESTGVDPERLQSDFTGEQPAESSKVQAALNDTGYGWGIVQWTPPSSIITTAQKAGASLQTIDTLSYQLQFLCNELNTSYPTVLAQLKSVTSPVNAATIFLSGFERGNPSPTRQIYAQDYYNLEVNHTPLPPNTPASTNLGGTDNSVYFGSQCAGNTASINTTGYKNPYRSLVNPVPMRIDEGVDYGGSGPIYAIGDGTVVVADNGSAHWPGGNYVSYRLSDGAYKGQYVYFAENCPLKVTVGQKVNSDTVICDLQDARPYSESGWSMSQVYNDTPMAYCPYLHAADGAATAFGYNFNQLLVSLGARSGTYQYNYQEGGRNLVGSLPNGWPNSQTAQQAPGVLQC